MLHPRLVAARIDTAPAQDVAEVVGGAKRKLHQGRKTLLELLVCPNKAGARIRQTLICPFSVGL